MYLEEVTLKLVYSENGDWVAVYVNNKLDRDGHNINWLSLILEYRYFSEDVQSYTVSQEYMEKGLPTDFNDIDKDKINKER